MIYGKHSFWTFKKLHTTNWNWNLLVLILPLSVFSTFHQMSTNFFSSLALIVWFSTWDTWSYSRYAGKKTRFTFLQVCQQNVFAILLFVQFKSTSLLGGILAVFGRSLVPCTRWWEWHIKPLKNSELSHSATNSQRNYSIVIFSFTTKRQRICTTEWRSKRRS